MPSSRKRRAGKARRIAAANAPPRIRPDCTHGCPPPPPDDSHIMFQCWEMVRKELEAPGNSCAIKLMEMALRAHGPIFHTPTLQTTFRQLLVAKGTSLLLTDLASKVTTEGPSCIASLVLIMDDYDKERGVFQTGDRNLSTMQKIRDLYDGDQCHALIRFYANNIPCKCLQQQDAAAKTESKRACCFHCNMVRERRLLHLCTGCKYNLYCSVECQRADWPMHKDDCKKYAEIHTVAPTVPQATGAPQVP